MTPFVIALLLFWFLPAGPDPQPSFRTESRLVMVDVTVRDPRGGTVTSLDRAAFTVYEDGKAQPIRLLLSDDTPVSIGMVIDNSGSMRTKRAAIEAAALAFVRSSNPVDEVFVVNFADKPRLDVPFTSNMSALEHGIARTDSIGGTAMRDAVAMALGYLIEHGSRDRKILLVISDGDDNSSAASADTVRDRAERGGIAVYAVGLPQDKRGEASRARHELDDLTERTGGVALHLAAIEDLEPTMVRLSHEVRQQYTLGYTPINTALDGSYRKIRVTVRTPQKVSVRNRAGYFAIPGK